MSRLEGKTLVRITLRLKIRNNRKNFQRLRLALKGFNAFYSPNKPMGNDPYAWIHVSLTFIGRQVGAEKGVEIDNRVKNSLYMVFANTRYHPWRTWKE
jgi:hypothetical protein